MISKIRHLIALAAHPATPVEEPRTSAVTACRLIVENGVDLRGAGESNGSWYPSRGQPAFDWRDLIDALFRVVTATAAREDFVRRTERATTAAQDFARATARATATPPRRRASVEDFMRESKRYANPVKGGTKRVRKRAKRRRGN